MTNPDWNAQAPGDDGVKEVTEASGDQATSVTPSPPHLLPDAAELFAQLAAEPFAYDFFQAVRRLECAAGAAGLPRVGRSTRAEQDPVRFAQDPVLSFAPSNVASFAPPADGKPGRMSVNFFGMWGPNGPLPTHLTEYAQDRQRQVGDATLSRFMDVFHHRMVSLFYRAWAVNQQVVGTDRSMADDPGADAAGADGADGGGDRFAAYVGSLIGRGMPSLRGRDAVADDAKLHWAGHLSGETAHAEGLASILSGHFGFPCEVIPFAGQWIDLPPESRCRLGQSRETGTLGLTSIVGSTVWDCQGKFRLRLGPMPLAQFARLLPGQPGNRQLRAWIRNYAGDQLAWEARVVLKADAVPGVYLGGNPDRKRQLDGAGLLGWSTWLPTSGEARRDEDDLILHS